MFCNQCCQPKEISFTENDAAVQENAFSVSVSCDGVRVMKGSGHSLPPVVNTDGIPLDLKFISAMLQRRAATKRCPSVPELQSALYV